MHDHHVVWLWLLGIYPVLHGGATVFAKYMPPPEAIASKWYPAIYHTIQFFAIGNGNGKNGTQPPTDQPKKDA